MCRRGRGRGRRPGTLSSAQRMPSPQLRPTRRVVAAPPGLPCPAQEAIAALPLFIASCPAKEAIAPGPLPAPDAASARFAPAGPRGAPVLPRRCGGGGLPGRGVGTPPAPRRRAQGPDLTPRTPLQKPPAGRPQGAKICAYWPPGGKKSLIAGSNGQCGARAAAMDDSFIIVLYYFSGVVARNEKRNTQETY